MPSRKLKGFDNRCKKGWIPIRVNRDPSVPKMKDKTACHPLGVGFSENRKMKIVNNRSRNTWASTRKRDDIFDLRRRLTINSPTINPRNTREVFIHQRTKKRIIPTRNIHRFRTKAINAHLAWADEMIKPVRSKQVPQVSVYKENSIFLWSNVTWI